jgi:DNA-directed RNA polymerase I subunit RPA2
MIRKLYALVSGECVEDNQDAANNQEVLMAGHLFCMQFKEKLQDWCSSVKLVALKELRMKNNATVDLEDWK